MNSTREVMEQADELDARRRHQIDNQVAAINRLLEDGSYDSEMAYLHDELALAHAKIERLEKELKDLKEERDGS